MPGWSLFLLLTAFLPACDRSSTSASSSTTADPVWKGLDRHEIQLAQKVLVVRGSKGVVVCPHLNFATFTRTGEACAIVPAKDLDGIPGGRGESGGAGTRDHGGHVGAGGAGSDSLTGTWGT